MFAGLPDTPALAELKAKNQWVAWKYVERDGRATKPPINPNTGRGASHSDPSTWSSYDRAAQFASENGMPGVGFVLTDQDDYTGIDLDKCIGADGSLEPWAEYILQIGETYAEVSPSGQGLRLIARGKVAKSDKCDPARVEIYKDRRYLTITGNKHPHAPDEIAPAPLTLAELAARISVFKPETTQAVKSDKPIRTDFVGQVNAAALASLSAWVPELLPAAQPSKDGFRVTSADLGRELQEDLSITSNGIVDFGVADMGDPAEGRRTATDLVLEHGTLGGHATEREAALWLCEQLEVTPAEMGMLTAAEEFDQIDIGLPPASIERKHRIVRASDFAPLETPTRQFLVEDFIPHKNVTILGGDGATGKSLLAMQLGVAAATSTRWIGQEVKFSGPVLYFSAEDDEDETHIRLKDICKGSGLDIATLHDLRICLMAGEDALLAIEHVQGAALRRTKLFATLRDWLAEIRPVLLVLDNLADIFGGNENVKALARQFIGMLRGLAIEFECSVVLLAHPSLTGMASGSGSSGNVAWNNSVRSRLYLQRDKSDDGVEFDPDRRVLEVKKANYAGTGKQLEIRWERGRFEAIDIPELIDLDDANPDGAPAGAETKIHKAERVFMEMVERFNHEKRNVSPSPGANYAPTLFAKHPKVAGVSRSYLEMAMNNLLGAGRIVVEMVGPPAKQRKSIVFARGKPEGLPTPLPTPSNASC